MFARYIFVRSDRITIGMSAGIEMTAGGKPHVDGCGPTQKLWPKGQILLQNGDYFGALEMQMADGTRPVTPVEIAVGGLRVCLEREIGWQAEASHLYYSAGWLFEPEQAAMSSLHKSGRGDKLGAERRGAG